MRRVDIQLRVNIELTFENVYLGLVSLTSMLLGFWKRWVGVGVRVRVGVSEIKSESESERESEREREV